MVFCLYMVDVEAYLDLSHGSNKGDPIGRVYASTQLIAS